MGERQRERGCRRRRLFPFAGALLGWPPLEQAAGVPRSTLPGMPWVGGLLTVGRNGAGMPPPRREQRSNTRGLHFFAGEVSSLEALPLLLSQTRFSWCPLPSLLLSTCCCQHWSPSSRVLWPLNTCTPLPSKPLPPTCPPKWAPGPGLPLRVRLLSALPPPAPCSSSCSPESEGQLLRDSRRAVPCVCMGVGEYWMGRGLRELAGAPPVPTSSSGGGYPGE